MLNKKNGIFVLSIVTLALATLFLGLVIACRMQSDPWTLAALVLISIPCFVLANVALIRGIIYIARKVPLAIETTVMAAISVFLFIVVIFLACFVFGTGRLPHEVLY